MTSGRTGPHVVVVGGGIAGLAGAYRLRTRLGERARITVVEQAAAVGGKLRTVELAGVGYDVGAEAFLVRRPEALTLIGQLGLSDQVVHPSPARPSLRAAGRTVPLPGRTLLGVPAAVDAEHGAGTADELAGVLSADGLDRARAEAGRPLSWAGGDVAVGELVTERFGPEVTRRLVDPLLGGVYAGHADALGLRATMPALAAKLDAAAAAGRPLSLTEAAASVLHNAPAGPVFGALRGGMRVLVDALVAGSAAEVRCGLPVRALAPAADGWRLEIGSAPRPEVVVADAVLLAVPPPALRRLLAAVHPAASATAGEIEVASSVVVSMAMPDGFELPDSSGVLVAADEPLRSKAFTFSSRKWPHLGAKGTLLRASLGRHGESAELPTDDAELVETARCDLAMLTGLPIRAVTPVDAVVTRWGGGLPQYAVGHTDRVAAIETAVAGRPGLAVAGAALHGVGIPACIATGNTAADRIAAQLETLAALSVWPS